MTKSSKRKRYTQVFISYSSKDEDIAEKFGHFLQSLDTNLRVFCTTFDNVINQGENFNESINRGISQCDIFIPLLSENYIESKYCMVELGFFSAILYQKNEKKHILPFSIPPIDKGEALSSTPLSALQVREINTRSQIQAFVDQLNLQKLNLQNSYMLNTTIDSFVLEINRVICNKQNFLKQAVPLAICSDGTRKDAIKFVEATDGYTLSLTPLENSKFVTYPDFLSFVLKFPKKINFAQYLKINDKAFLSFELDCFSDFINKIDVEFRYTDNLLMLKEPGTFPVSKGINKLKIMLSDMNINGLKNISEICFVIWESYFKNRERSEGSYCIKNLKVNV